MLAHNQVSQLTLQVEKLQVIYKLKLSKMWAGQFKNERFFESQYN